MLFALVSGFDLSLAAPFPCRRARRGSGWLLALLPSGLLVYFALFIVGVGLWKGSIADEL